MKRFAITLVTWMSLAAYGADNVPAKINAQAQELVRRLFSPADRADLLDVIPAKMTDRDIAFYSPYRFFMLRIEVKGPVPVGAEHPGFTIAATPDAAFPLRSSIETCAFLTALKRPVKDEIEALQLIRLLGAIRTTIPEKESLHEQFKKQRAEDYLLIVAGTESGWKITVTVSRFGYDRLELAVSKDGRVSVITEKTVYIYAAQE